MKAVKEKRIVRRPWGRRLMGGWVIQPEDLIESLKDGHIAEFNKIKIGAKQLRELIKLMVFPDQEFLVKTNGRLEVHNVRRVMKKQENGTVKTHFRKPRLVHYFGVDSGAWVPGKANITLVIKPRKF